MTDRSPPAVAWRSHADTRPTSTITRAATTNPPHAAAGCSQVRVIQNRVRVAATNPNIRLAPTGTTNGNATSRTTTAAATFTRAATVSSTGSEGAWPMDPLMPGALPAPLPAARPSAASPADAPPTRTRTGRRPRTQRSDPPLPPPPAARSTLTGPPGPPPACRGTSLGTPRPAAADGRPGRSPHTEPAASRSAPPPPARPSPARTRSRPPDGHSPSAPAHPAATHTPPPHTGTRRSTPRSHDASSADTGLAAPAPPPHTCPTPPRHQAHPSARAPAAQPSPSARTMPAPAASRPDHPIRSTHPAPTGPSAHSRPERSRTSSTPAHPGPAHERHQNPYPERSSPQSPLPHGLTASNSGSTTCLSTYQTTPLRHRKSPPPHHSPTSLLPSFVPSWPASCTCEPPTHSALCCVRVVRKQPRLRRQARTGQNEAKPVAEPVVPNDGSNDGFASSASTVQTPSERSAKRRASPSSAV